MLGSNGGLWRRSSLQTGHLGERCSIVTRTPALANAGTMVIAVAPEPITTTCGGSALGHECLFAREIKRRRHGAISGETSANSPACLPVTGWAQAKTAGVGLCP